MQGQIMLLALFNLVMRRLTVFLFNPQSDYINRQSDYITALLATALD